MKKLIIITLIIGGLLTFGISKALTKSAQFSTGNYATADNFMDNLDNFSVVVKFKTSIVQNGLHQPLVQKGNWYSGTENSWGFYTSPLSSQNNQYIRFQLFKDNTGWFNAYDSVHLVNDGEWHCAAGVYDRGNNLIKVYVDGQDNSELDTSGWQQNHSFSNTHSITVGEVIAHTRPYNGLGSEISLWTKTLSISEVQNVCGSNLGGTETDLESYWSFYNTLEDLTGNGHNLTQTGTINFVEDVPNAGTPTPTPTLTPTPTPSTASCNIEAKDLIQTKINNLQSELNSLQTLLNSL